MFEDPTSEAMKRAYVLQRGSFDDGKTSPTSANERDVAVAIVHSRQDLVLAIGMQVECHRQLVTIARGVWLLVLMGALAFWHWRI